MKKRPTLKILDKTNIEKVIISFEKVYNIFAFKVMKMALEATGRKAQCFH